MAVSKHIFPTHAILISPPINSCRQRKPRARRTRRVLPLLRALQGKRARLLSRRKPAKRRQPGAKATTGKSTTSTSSGLSSGPGWSTQPIYLNVFQCSFGFSRHEFACDPIGKVFRDELSKSWLESQERYDVVSKMSASERSKRRLTL